MTFASNAGADVNTATSHVLGRVSGLTASRAVAIVEYRAKHGLFQCREDLKCVKGIGPITFRNVAGFLRVEGTNPLDATVVHPEQYTASRELIQAALGRRTLSDEDLAKVLFTEQLRAAFSSCDWTRLQSEVCGGAVDVVGLQTIGRWVSDSSFCSTAMWDVRGIRGVAPRLVRRGLPRPADLRPGATLGGTVRNITSFGVFVDIGAEEDALLHRSEYAGKADGFVIGEWLPSVTILAVSAEKGGKISLTLRHGAVEVAEASCMETPGKKRKHMK